MNLIDLFAVVVVAVAILQGIYKGFINSVSKVGAFFLSCIVALLFAPGLAAHIEKTSDIFPALNTYVEGAEKLGNIENAKRLVEGINERDLNAIVTNASFPEPFPSLIQENVRNLSFQDKGITTLGEYANMTIVCTVMNILCFLLIFFVAAAALFFMINALDRSLHFPVLRQMDGLLGGGFGLILGCFTLFVIFLIVPIILVAMEVKYVSEYLNGSFLGSFFYKSNFLLKFMTGCT